MKKYFPPSELIINEDGSVFHLHVKPEHLADKVILVGDPGRVALVASHFETKECEVESREFRTITGTYKGKRITVTSTGIGCDNVDIVMNELDALANINFQTREENDNWKLYVSVLVEDCNLILPWELIYALKSL
jgi:uridine phosphorylase